MDQKSTGNYGHRRQPALGKAMPVTALLLNLEVNPLDYRRSDGGSEVIEEDDIPPQVFSVTDEPPSPNDDDFKPPNHHEEDKKLAGDSQRDIPCANCLRSAPDHLIDRHMAINEMCHRLCGPECRQPQGLTLDGFRQDFLRQYEIAEAVAKTSAMTSTVQMKQRLAARKLEIEKEMDEQLGVASPHIDINLGQSSSAATPASTSAGTGELEFEPPRDLLLYLVR
ncbi:nocturnin-like [Drosophila eugracilis]|uniref:nocturnin-like n=1 Tax=Drosophila eugracilis TaxID=29029 RepID=UPI001BDB6687|nr:nocturnin-like [Drosophila eugracilis]